MACGPSSRNDEAHEGNAGEEFASSTNHQCRAASGGDKTRLKVNQRA